MSLGLLGETTVRVPASHRLGSLRGAALPRGQEAVSKPGDIQEDQQAIAQHLWRQAASGGLPPCLWGLRVGYWQHHSCHCMPLTTWLELELLDKLSSGQATKGLVSHAATYRLIMD